MRKWWIGCSGYYYKPWRGKFYPQGLPVRKWFEYYCKFFNTVELNVTFYRYPKLSDLNAWYERSPDDFRFTAKANRLITHFKKFKDAKRQTEDFYSVVAKGLREKLGTILFQLHPSFPYSEENLDRILTTLNPSFNNVVEFRDESWWRKEVYATLKENNITFCNISYPDLPDDVHKTAPVMYYRFHGVPELYKSSYSTADMRHVVDKLKSFRGSSDIFIYFNNDIDVAAVENAGSIMRLIHGNKIVFPEV